MNHLHAKPTSWTCRWVRAVAIMSSQSGSDHIARCPACQEYFAAEVSFDRQMRQEAVVQRVDPPSGLDARILRAIRDQSEPARRFWRPRFDLIALAAAAACAVAVAIWFGADQFGVAPAGAEAAIVVQSEQPAGMDPSLWPETMKELRPTVESLMTESSLQMEAATVYSNARSAMQFLALNFLPTTDGVRRDTPATRPAQG